MTPTLSLILLVALFWTLPASAAVLTYRKHGSSIENVKAVWKLLIEDAFETVRLRPRPEM
jgi:hypothetical protein